MKKMTIRKLLENIVAKSYGQKIKKFYLVSTDGEVVTADFAIDLVRNVASCNFLWEVEVVSAKRVDDYDNTCNHSNGKQVKSKSPVNENENGNENEERERAQPGRRRPRAVLIASGPHIPAESASRTP